MLANGKWGGHFVQLRGGADILSAVRRPLVLTLATMDSKTGIHHLSPLARASPQTFPQGLYIHIPFCAAICTYCDFASEVYTAGRTQIYLSALETELRVRTDVLSPGSLFAPRTIFLGGGTPSSLSIEELTRFFEILKRHVNIDGADEFTIEANPGSTDPAKLEFLLTQGVNRISFGVQSFQPHLLKILGRVHGASQGREAVRMARVAGFNNISIDLLHGVPTQSLDNLRTDLDEALNLETEHISAYGLIYEDGTPLKNAVARGVCHAIPPEQETLLYRMVMDHLERGGLPQYEISNYAKPGMEARHNLIYWRNEAYLGIGVSAASFVNWERSVNNYDMNAYIHAATASGGAMDTSEVLEPTRRAREALILELRLRRGVDPIEFLERWNYDILNDCAPMSIFLKEGLIEKLENGRFRIAQSSLPVADGILAEIV